MKTLFDIRADEQATGQPCLLLEIGKDYCALAVWYRDDNTIQRLHFASYNEMNANAEVTAFINDLTPQGFQSVIVCSAFSQALLSPAKFTVHQEALLQTIYDEPADYHLNDAIPEWQMSCLYAIPIWLHQLVQASFTSVTYFHAYTPSIKMYNGFVADNQLSVHFTPQYFRVLLKKDSAIQLAQTYHYTAPLDVVYYLLKICGAFELEQQSVVLILSGLIEKDSALFTGLEQYFSNLHFANPPDIKCPSSQYPQHFFTSLYNLATCVS